MDLAVTVLMKQLDIVECVWATVDAPDYVMTFPWSVWCQWLFAFRADTKLPLPKELQVNSVFQGFFGECH